MLLFYLKKKIIHTAALSIGRSRGRLCPIKLFSFFKVIGKIHGVGAPCKVCVPQEINLDFVRLVIVDLTLISS